MRVRFDRFELDSDLRLLMDGAQPVHVSPKALRLLEILIESRPRPLSKQELTDTIWADTFVDESNLAGLITEIRGALGDDARRSPPGARDPAGGRPRSPTNSGRRPLFPSRT